MKKSILRAIVFAVTAALFCTLYMTCDDSGTNSGKHDDRADAFVGKFNRKPSDGENGNGNGGTPTTPTTYTLTIERDPTTGGTTNPASSPSNITAGTQVSISATAASGYTFSGWTVTSGSGTIASASSASTTVTVNGNVTVRANFTQNSATTYTLTVERNPTNGGTTNPASSQSNITAGTQVSISATAASGYTFSGWTVTSGSGTVANTSSASTTVTVNGNVTVRANFTQNSTGGSDTFTDSRDGKTYKKVQIGGKWWMAENLNYDTADGRGSWCYGNKLDSCVKYGRLYNWSTSMAGKGSSTANPSGVRGVCPSGWHLPSMAEWSDLVTAAGYNAGNKLKSKSGWIENGNGSDDYGFSALPGGGRYSDGSFTGVGYFGDWWTATEDGSGDAYDRDMRYYDGIVREDTNDKSLGLSVRCLQDE